MVRRRRNLFPRPDGSKYSTTSLPRRLLHLLRRPRWKKSEVTDTLIAGSLAWTNALSAAVDKASCSSVDYSGWLGSRVVSVLDSGAEGPGFKSQPRRCRVTSLRQTVHTHRASVHEAAKLAAALLRVARVTAGLAESNGSLYRRVYDSRHLQAAC